MIKKKLLYSLIMGLILTGSNNMLSMPVCHQVQYAYAASLGIPFFLVSWATIEHANKQFKKAEDYYVWATDDYQKGKTHHTWWNKVSYKMTEHEMNYMICTAGGMCLINIALSSFVAGASTSTLALLLTHIRLSKSV